MKESPRGEGGDGATVESVIEESFRFAGRLFIFNFRGARILTFFYYGNGKSFGENSSRKKGVVGERFLSGKRERSRKDSSWKKWERSGKVLRGGMS